MASFHWEENVSLQCYNTFSIPVTTRYLVRIQNSRLSKLVQSPFFQDHRHVILGGGSNVLFAGKTYDGIVLKNEIMGIETLARDDMHTTLKVGGGVAWSFLVDYCLTHKLGGIENLSLIPGTVGAAPIQNIGAYGVELSDVLESVEIVDLTDGKTRTMTRAECMFGYRDSIFKRLKDVLVCTVTVKLTNAPHHRLNTTYGSIQQVLSERDCLTPTISSVSEAVCLLRKHKLPDPRELGNAGSFFQNVTVDDCTCQSLKTKYPALPVFTKAQGRNLIPAAWFIEQCGWKGRRIGRVGRRMTNMWGELNGLGLRTVHRKENWSDIFSVTTCCDFTAQTLARRIRMLSTDLKEALRYESPAHMPGFPPSISPIHFVCIGGHGQSAIALILLKLGYVVQGSDIKESDNVVRLRAAGATVFIGHDKDQLGSAKLVVASSAATWGSKPNVEVEAARERRIPVIHRSEMLASLMRHHKSIAICGSHGKSTTTSMVAGMLEAGGLSPTTISGAVVTQYGSNAHMGSGNWMVVEADESDGTMVQLPALISVVTNIDSDHITFYGTQEKTRATFAQFVRNVPFYGLAVLCIDDPGVRKMLPEVQDRNIITYGVSEDADVRAEDVKYNPQDSTFVLSVRNRRDGTRRVVGCIVLNVLGLHNLQNALATTAIALELGIELESIRYALRNFQGTNRRYIHVGEANGIQIIDDFGTHPAEMKATQTMAKQAGARRIIAVYQPTAVVRNVEAWLEEYPAAFEESAHIIIGQADGVGVDPVPAGKARETLVQYLHSHGREDAISMPDPSALPELVSRLGQEGDFVVCMGFRSSTLWARALAGQLKALGNPGMKGDQ
ncbi:predicted protein [Aspergillus terreus NIH2624]|uniref:FAD-binding PCMH-type domain-containing protein n=1 Tax=Aspergillus terreus (strain NIH 2624 / FGSC A1156) TaxID=341663 RepID=Q0CZR5_ASPTN|nr:uncharacterized protein ATEG_00819 [Aspergillus terreus NIH2624]EAU39465.1 predicted protein [Aspergillus terreus NIH2624]